MESKYLFSILIIFYIFSCKKYDEKYDEDIFKKEKIKKTIKKVVVNPKKPINLKRRYLKKKNIIKHKSYKKNMMKSDSKKFTSIYVPQKSKTKVKKEIQNNTDNLPREPQVLKDADSIFKNKKYKNCKPPCIEK
jgi:hypothetical protein